MLNLGDTSSIHKFICSISSLNLDFSSGFTVLNSQYDPAYIYDHIREELALPIVFVNSKYKAKSRLANATSVVVLDDS